MFSILLNQVALQLLFVFVVKFLPSIFKTAEYVAPSSSRSTNDTVDHIQTIKFRLDVDIN